MRPFPCGLAAVALVCHAGMAGAQQGTVQLSAAAQGVSGSPERVGDQDGVYPDFGVSWLQPGSRFGTLQIDLTGTRRGNRLHPGRGYAALRDVKFAGLSWSFEAGDAHFIRPIADYRFTNLTTPTVTFSGGAVTGRSPRGSLQILGGRTTAWRNIFGSDADTLAQWLQVGHGSYRVSDRLEVLGRASRVRTSGLREFNFTIADSRQIGGGARFTLTPAIQLVADGGLVQFRRVDSGLQERDGSFLAGASVLLRRGWLQLNAARFSPGEFPAMNDPLHDRQSLFAAGEYDVTSAVRVYGGYETFRTNLTPERAAGTARELPRSLGNRGFAGVRFVVGAQSAITLRIEDGDAILRPVRGGLETESDTGVWSAEWQAVFGSLSSYTRASRRENVSRTSLDSSYTQLDLSTQLFMRLSRSAQVFGVGTVTKHESGAAAGSSYWQLGGGAQIQVPRRDLWLRGEATASRNVDLLTRDFVPRESLNMSVNGQLSPATLVSFNISADRTPLLFGTGSPWATRSMVRVTQRFSTGAARVPAALGSPAAAATRARGSGTILGTVYADWNANGIREPDEEALENIPVRLAAFSSVTSRKDGEFSFLNVPAGPQQVGLDTGAIPVDFDPPPVSAIDLELDRDVTRRVTFGLIPLGTVRGRVVRDANGNGRADPGEEPIEGAVLVMDGGARSEEVRSGVYRFDAIRSGDHVVALLRESLPEGSVITGATEVPLALRRNQLVAEIDFAVAVEKRPELRRVFPPRGGSPAPAPASPTAAASRPAARATPGRLPAAPATRSGSSTSGMPPAAAGSRRPAPTNLTRPPSRATPGDVDRFTVQIAALNDPARARTIVTELIAAGYPAYLVEPGRQDPEGPYRVRVGTYRSRAAAAATAARLERVRQEKLWVVRGK